MIWVGGSSATRQARRIAEKLNLGEAFVGMLLLGVITSLPEVATTASAARIGDAALAGSNLLGGVALQIALLAVVDGLALRSRALTGACGENGLARQAVLLAGLSLLAVIGILIHSGSSSPLAYSWPVALVAVYIGGVYWIYLRGQSGQDEGTAGQQPASQRASGMKTGLLFAASSAAVFVGGYLVAESASALAVQWGISSSAIGATLVAMSTSLPEYTTTFAAVRIGSIGMAIGNILGTNALELALFLPADLLYAPGPIIGSLGPSEITIGCVNVLLALILLCGLKLRVRRTILGFGPDSLAILAVYAIGLWLVYAVI